MRENLLVNLFFIVSFDSNADLINTTSRDYCIVSRKVKNEFMKIDFLFRTLKMVLILPLLTLVYEPFAKLECIEYPDNKAPINANSQDAFIQYEQMPQFPGGEKAMIKFIKSNLKYPDIARKIGASGTVIINFEADDRSFMLPAIDIVSAIGNTPMFKVSAKPFFTIPSQQIDGNVQVKIPFAKGIEKDTYIKAFLKDESQSSSYQLKLKVKSSYKIN